MPLALPEFLKKESIVSVKKLQDFEFLDRDTFIAGHDVEVLAKKQAKLNLPLKTAKGLDANELKFTQQLSQHAIAATMTLNDSLADIANSIARIDVEAEKSELDNAVNMIEADLKREYDSQSKELEQLKAAAELSQDDVDKFKKKNGLKQEAVYKDTYMMTWALILGALVIETALNSTLLAEASNYGLVGGASMAIIISLINIALGFVTGFAIFPYTNHINRAISILSYASLMVGFAVVLTFNLLIGHYREVLIQNPDNSGVLAMTHFSEGIFNLTEIESIFLVFIGLIVSGISYWKGMTQNDRFPGYTSVSKQRDSMRDDLYEAKEAALNELNLINDQFAQWLLQLHKKVSHDFSRCKNLYSTFEQQQKLYEAYIGDLSHTGQIALSLYRQVNQSQREDDAPAYFNKAIKVNFKQKPTVPKLIDLSAALNKVVEDFGSRIPGLKIEFSKAVEGYRKKIIAIDL